MIEWFITFFTTLGENPIATGILASTLIGGLLYLCRELPKRIWFFFWNSITIEMSLVQENSPTAFNVFEDYLEKCKLYYISGSFMSVFKYFSKEMSITPGEYGYFFCKIGGTWAIIRKYTDKQVSFWHSYCYTVRFFTRNKEKLDKFFKQAYQDQRTLSQGDTIKVFQYVEGGWNYSSKPKIPFTAKLPKIKQDICNTVEYFLNNKEEYIKKGKPYREGFILSGEPGTGKSYFIQQLASKFSLNVFYVNLNSFATDSAYIKALMQISLPAIILIEDIDDCNAVLKRTDGENFNTAGNASLKSALKNPEGDGEIRKGVTLATVLNSLDGLLASESQLCVITTNHIEKLDPALIRAGRFNTNVVFEKLYGEEICQILSRYYETEIKNEFEDVYISVAELSAICNNKSLEEAKQVLFEKYKREN